MPIRNILFKNLDSWRTNVSILVNYRIIWFSNFQLYLLRIGHLSNDFVAASISVVDKKLARLRILKKNCADLRLYSRHGPSRLINSGRPSTIFIFVSLRSSEGKIFWIDLSGSPSWRIFL